MFNQWFKLSILALLGLMISSLALGALSGFGKQSYPAATISNPTGGSYDYQKPPGPWGFGNGPSTRRQSTPQNFNTMNIPGQMPNLNVHEDVNVRIQMPNGMNVQMNKSEGMSNMRGMGMINK